MYHHDVQTRLKEGQDIPDPAFSFLLGVLGIVLSAPLFWDTTLLLLSPAIDCVIGAQWVASGLTLFFSGNLLGAYVEYRLCKRRK